MSTIPTSTRLSKEIAQLSENFGLGKYSGAGTDRTIFTGEMPAALPDSSGNLVDIMEAIWIVESPSPPPHEYVDTEYLVLDFWSRSPKTDRAHSLLEQVFNNFNRRYSYDTANWHIYFSRALGGIVDADRDAENGKLFRLSVQFICRNFNNVS